jgi:hypothetical protein
MPPELTQAMAIIERVGRPNLKLQLDLYHVQIMEGDSLTASACSRAIARMFRSPAIPARIPAAGRDQSRARLGPALRHFELEQAPHPSPLPARGERVFTDRQRVPAPLMGAGQSLPGLDPGVGVMPPRCSGYVIM